MRTLAAIAVCFFLSPLAALADDAKILEIVGPTMGTRYMVKIFDPSSMDLAPADAQIGIDALLRRINDQMSTYLDQSEITRFNQSKSTEWFDVSPAFVRVVEFAQQVAEKTDGAFDITVGPLVNAWNFGPEPRTQAPPDDERIEELRASVGYQKLSVRLDPPALKKSHPDLQIDLSSIAKGGDSIAGRRNGHRHDRPRAQHRKRGRSGDGNVRRLPKLLRVRGETVFAHDRSLHRSADHSLTGVGFGGCRVLHGGRRLGHCN